ncbi:MAG: hypothetical protein IH790_08300 [Acidobacteria bacterium]|nr:hypothetical protein [Acidobacteriota bacterium]
MRYRFPFALVVFFLLASVISAVPTDEVLIVRMIDPVDSDVNQIGETFRATLEGQLKISEEVIAPKGTPVLVQLVHVKQSGQLRGREEIALQLRSITLDGESYYVSSQFAEVASESKGEETAKVVGGAAAIGAIVGAITGGKKGAAIGAATGAGAGTAIQLVRGQRVYVPSEALLAFKRQDLNATKQVTMPHEPGNGEWETDHVPVFGKSQESIIRDWFSNKKNLKGLPPGLAKRKRLPPGLERQLRRNGSMPPGLEKRVHSLPLDLDRLLPDLPTGIRRVIIGVAVVLLDETSNRILDIVRKVLS